VTAQIAFAAHPILERTLREQNPWWSGGGPPQVETYRRWIFEPVLRGLSSKLAPVVVVRGPRQVGKTTVQSQVIRQLLSDGVPPTHILRVQFDALPALTGKALSAPVLEIAWWYSDQVLRRPLASVSRDTPVYLMLDEVQNLGDWATQVKHLVDTQPGIRALVTGSSALRIEAGRDSLAGRIHSIELGPLLLREVADLRGGATIPVYHPANGLEPLKHKDFWIGLREHANLHAEARNAAFTAFSERGGYPVAHKAIDEPWERVADQLVETVVKRAIQHDLRVGERGRKRDQRLLEEVFRLACRYCGQTPRPAAYVDEIKRALATDVGPQRVRHYLNFLDQALLVRLVQPLELRLKKRKSGPKLVLTDHTLRAAWLQETIPLAPAGLLLHPHLSDLAGRVAESVCGQFLVAIRNMDVAYLPESGADPEVDYVITIGEQRIPIEVKYRRRIDHADTRGLRSFIEKSHYNAPFGILATLEEASGSDDPRIVSLPLSSLLLLR
jgi:hypothetical protein